MKILRKLTVLVLIVAMLMSVGCAKRKSDVALNEIRYVSESDPWFDTAIVEDDPVDIGCNISNGNIALAKDDYFVEYAEGYNYIDCEWKSVLYKYDYSGNRLGRFDIVEAFSSEADFSEFVRIFVYNDVDYYVISNSMTNEMGVPGDTTFVICTLDYDKNSYEVVDKKTFSEVFPGWITVSDVAVSGDYVVYLLYSDEEYAFYVENMVDGSSYHVIFNAGNDYNFCSFHTCPCRQAVPCDGLIYYSVLRDNDEAYYSFDPTTGVYKEVRKADYLDGIFMADGTIVHADRDMGVKRDSIITGETVCDVFDVRNCAVTASCANYIDLVAYNGNSLIVRGGIYDNGIQANKFFVITPSDTNPHAGKQIITIGYTQVIAQNVEKLIVDNNMNPDSEYYLQIVNDYDWSKHWEMGDEYYELSDEISDVFIRDVKSGYAPDIMIGGDRVAVAVADLVFADLSSYIDNSEVITRDNFSSVVFDGFRIDGCLYNIPYDVCINGLAVEASSFDGTGFTYDEYINHINAHNFGNDALLTSNYYEYDNTKMNYFERLFEIEFCDYLSDGKFNITKGEQGDRFRKLAEFVNNKDSLYKAEDGESITLSNKSAYSFRDYISTNRAKVRNYVGYPSFDGKSTCFTNIADTVAITACCADKDAAWSIVENLFTYDSQMCLSTSIPVRLDALADICDDVIEGIRTNPDDYYLDWNTSDFDLNLYKDELITIVKNMDTAVYCDTKVMLIMREELPAYFEGQKTFDEVVDIIENRVNNYLSEIKS